MEAGAWNPAITAQHALQQSKKHAHRTQDTQHIQELPHAMEAVITHLLEAAHAHQENGAAEEQHTVHQVILADRAAQPAMEYARQAPAMELIRTAQ